MGSMGGVGGRPAFVGRVRELTQLREALHEVIAASGRLILLAGETGIGKTRLAEELAREARERGANVAWGRAWGEEGAPDLWPWMQVIRACLRAVDESSLRELVGPHGSELTALVALRGTEAEASPASRFRLFNAIAHFLETYSARAPLLIILEDLHRADPASLRLLRFFTQEQRQRRILLIGSYREPDAPPNRFLTQTVIEAMREPASERVVLAGLTVEESETLLRSLLGDDVPRSLAEALHRRTAGNPLFLIECARQLQGRAGRAARIWESGGSLPIPGELREVMEQRLEPLCEEHRALLAVAASSGGAFRTDDVVHAVGAAADMRTVSEALAQAEALGVLRSGDGPECWRFAQGMMREWLAKETFELEPLSIDSTEPPTAVDATTAATFRREGEYWTIAFAGNVCRMKDTKGLAYVAFLLRQPHVDIHVSELANLASSPADAAGDSIGAEVGSVRLGLGDAGVVIDSQAKAAYRMRLEELRADLQEAETLHDIGRAERIRNEIEFLTQELISATGLGGRDRRVGSAAERARVNITRAIIRALERIEESDPTLGDHLRRNIKTGTFCAYAPGGGDTVEWEL